MKALEDMIALMLTLRHTLSGQGGSPSRRGAWAGVEEAEYEGLQRVSLGDQ